MLVGGAGPEFSYQALNRAFGCLRGGARLVAMHRGLYWRTSEGLQLDSGAFVTGLEQAAGTSRPRWWASPPRRSSPPRWTHLGAAAADTLMVGDDIETDVLAAQRQGLTGVLVKTGKYLPSTHHDASGTPDHVLDSFADLPALLDQLSWAARPAGCLWPGVRVISIGVTGNPWRADHHGPHRRARPQLPVVTP